MVPRPLQVEYSDSFDRCRNARRHWHHRSCRVASVSLAGVVYLKWSQPFAIVRSGCGEGNGHPECTAYGPGFRSSAAWREFDTFRSSPPTRTAESAGRDLRILTDDGELIRALTLNPTRNYQPLGGRWPAHNVLQQAG